ncbi:MAG: tetratricopeptide repeat protein [Treponemataceae bacterium]|nr:tetratricopeptide repeat protein [Treponemataceae bacterium]
MSPIGIVIIAVLGTAIVFLLGFVIKMVATPRKVDGIQKLVKQGKNAQAIKLAKQLIARDPRDVMSHYWLGTAYLADNKPELALMEYKYVNQNAIFDNTTLPEAEFRKRIATLYSKFGQNEEALKEYLLLTKLDPHNADNFYNCARLFEERGKFDQAMGFYQQTIKLNKRHPKAHAAVGMLLYRAKQFPEAKKEIDLAIQMSPETYSSYYYLGKILKENKDYPAAVAAFEKALRDPEFKQKALIERGSCYMAANNIEKAIVEFDRAVKMSNNDASQETQFARYFLAACYEKTRKIELAITQWEAIFAKNKSFKDVGQKLQQYKDITANDSMKEYLTSRSEDFCDICKKVALTGFSLGAKSIDAKKFGCVITASDASKDDWMNQRNQLTLLVFYREPEPIEDSVIRKLADEVKAKNYAKAIVFTSTGFTQASRNFAENRPIELIDKQKLEQLLDKAI